MGLEARIEEIAREKGMKTKKQIEEERIRKLENADNDKGKTEINVKPIDVKDPYAFLLQFVGYKVRIELINNKMIEGMFERFNQFEIKVLLDDNRELVIMKHGILSIEKIGVINNK